MKKPVFSEDFGWESIGTARMEQNFPAMAQIVPVQCFLARTVLGWSGRKLANVAGASAHTVANFERGHALKTSTVEVIQRALEKAGIIFIDANNGGPGARLLSLKRLGGPPA